MEVPGSSPSTHIRQPTVVCYLSFGESDSCDIHEHLHPFAHTHTQDTYKYTSFKKIKDIFLKIIILKVIVKMGKLRLKKW